MANPTGPPARHKSKAPRRLVIALLVLIALLVVADRVGDAIAENVAAGKLQQSQHLPNKPDVDIHGFPFLTQAAARDFDDVTLTTTDFRIGNSDVGLTLNKVVVTLQRLKVTNDLRSFHVDHATAVATASYQSLGAALGVELTYVGKGLVRASKRISLAGFTITPAVTAHPELANGALHFVGDRASGLGEFSGALGTVVRAVFGDDIPLQGIPFDVRVDTLQATPDGLRLDLSGENLSYTR